MNYLIGVNRGKKPNWLIINELHKTTKMFGSFIFFSYLYIITITKTCRCIGNRLNKMAKNQYYTKGYVSQALMLQHFMVVSNRNIKLVTNFNGMDYALVQKRNHITGEIDFQVYIIIDEFWYSDDKRKANPITLKKLK